MKIKYLYASALALALAAACSPSGERPQWTEKQAWEWDRKVGVIKGFNQPEPAYPGQSLDEIISRMADLGFNSVRGWFGGDTAEEQVEKIRNVADIAGKYGMTVSPVLYLHRNYLHRDAPEEQNLADAEKCVRTIVRPFRDDDRIILWDIWNEPVFDPKDSANVMKELDWIEREVHWCREERLSQPITASIFWDTEKGSDTTSFLFRRRREVEMMMDLHNFHDYMCAEHFGEDARVMIGKMNRMGNRPLVCTECLTRVNGSGVGRTMAEFATKHVHFYIWGSFANDANWEVKWGRSTFDAYDEMFHNIMYADGDLIDYREIDLIRNFKFTDSAEEADQGLENTERWTHERAWKRMAGGPVKGQITGGAPSAGFNSVRISLSFPEYRADRDAFFGKFDAAIASAAAKGCTVMPVLLTDDTATASEKETGEYVGDVIGHYYDAPEIQAWDLYYHPGETLADSAKVNSLVTAVFRYARNEYPNQPLTATPYVKVKTFDPDYNYWGALVHGVRNGWDKLEYGGASDCNLVYRIWSLSDVLSFSTDQNYAEAGWLASLCYKFGRPVFCTCFAPRNESDKTALLELFGKNHINFYTAAPVSESVLRNFSFKPIVTKH